MVGHLTSSVSVFIEILIILGSVRCFSVALVLTIVLPIVGAILWIALFAYVASNGEFNCFNIRVYV